MALFSDIFTDQEKEEIANQLRIFEDHPTNFSSRHEAGFRRPKFPVLNKRVIGLNYFKYFGRDLSKFWSWSKGFIYLPIEK